MKAIQQQYDELYGLLNKFYEGRIEVESMCAYAYNIVKYTDNKMIAAYYDDDNHQWAVTILDEDLSEEVVYRGEYNAIDLLTKFTNAYTSQILL